MMVSVTKTALIQPVSRMHQNVNKIQENTQKFMQLVLNNLSKTQREFQGEFLKIQTTNKKLLQINEKLNRRVEKLNGKIEKLNGKFEKIEIQLDREKMKEISLSEDIVSFIEKMPPPPESSCYIINEIKTFWYTSKIGTALLVKQKEEKQRKHLQVTTRIMGQMDNHQLNKKSSQL
jgi:uncharacterized protein YPO0396